MQPHHGLRAIAFGAALITMTASTPTLAQHAPHGAARNGPHNCVRFARDEAADGRSIEFAVENQCEIPVVAIVSWSVACDETSNGTPEEHHESLEPGVRRVIVASANACGAGPYSIRDVRWSWRRAADEP
jgi:hypothetical protein